MDDIEFCKHGHEIEASKKHCSDCLLPLLDQSKAQISMLREALECVVLDVSCDRRCEDGECSHGELWVMAQKALKETADSDAWRKEIEAGVWDYVINFLEMERPKFASAESAAYWFACHFRSESKSLRAGVIKEDD